MGIMSNLPQGWATCNLDTVLTSLESGSRPKGGVRGIENGVPSIGGEHLTYKGTFDFSSIKYVPEKFAGKMKQGHIKPNDILIVKDGATTGKIAFVNKNFPFLNAVVNEHVFICRPSNQIEPRFLFRYLISREGQDRILENFRGSAQGGITLSFAPNTEVVLAPLNEQRRIVAKLEKLLQKVNACTERLDKIPAILKRFRQSVLAAACSGRLTEDDDLRKDPQYIEKDNDLDALPHAWHWVKLEDVCDRIVDCPHSTPKWSDKGRLCVRTTNFKPGLLYLNVKHFVSEATFIERIKRLRPKSGDVLYSREGGILGVACIIPPGVDLCLGQRMMLFRLGNDYVNTLLMHWLNSPVILNRVKELTGGSASPHINVQDIKKFPIPVPPFNEQKEIVRRVEALFKIADQIEERYKKARTYVDKLTQSILAKAFRGELVPQVPNDEPASELLKRIQEKKDRQTEKREKKVKK
jgi:type I restriction enzyme, S subunit